MRRPGRRRVRNVEVATAHHREGLGVVEVGRSWEFGDGLFAGVGEVEILLTASCEGPHVEHPVLRMEDDVQG